MSDTTGGTSPVIVGAITALIVLAALLLAAGAQAAPVTIDFDELAHGTTITDQYLLPHAAGARVRFGIKPDGSEAYPPYASGDANATSGPNVARVPGSGGEFCQERSLYGAFPIAHRHVELRAGSIASARLRGYDAAGQEVAFTALKPTPVRLRLVVPEHRTLVDLRPAVGRPD